MLLKYALDHSGASHGQHHNLHRLFIDLPESHRGAVERKYTEILNSTKASDFDVAETVDSSCVMWVRMPSRTPRYFWEPSRTHISEQASILFAPDMISPLIYALFIALHNYPSKPSKKRYDTTFQSLAESLTVRNDGHAAPTKGGSGCRPPRAAARPP